MYNYAFNIIGFFINMILLNPTILHFTDIRISTYQTFRPFRSGFLSVFSYILTIYNRHPTYHTLDHLWFAFPQLNLFGHTLSRLHRAPYLYLIAQINACRRISADVSRRYPIIPSVGLSVLLKSVSYKKLQFSV